MPTFALNPVIPGEFLTSPDLIVAVVDTTKSASEVWAEIHGAEPLHWCSSIRKIQWTSAEPHGVGATRTVTLFPGVRINERYTLWNESPKKYVNAFTVESATAPGLSRFSEKYCVEATETGSRFTWSFLVEPKGPVFFKSQSRKILEVIVQKMQKETEQYFNC
ncbi:MAG: SRPBCC family protein [Mycobacteriaceae bacterium]